MKKFPRISTHNAISIVSGLVFAKLGGLFGSAS